MVESKQTGGEFWMKRLFCLIFTVLFFVSVFPPQSAGAYSASGYCVIDSLTGRMLYSHNADAKRGMASTTKIMTAIVALENANPSDIATVSYNASRTEGSSLYLKSGEKMTVADLVYGLMLNSGNDAAVVLAEHIGGSVEAFAAMMNETAAKIGANSTHFTNPNGLYDDNHYTTAYDLALITRYGMKNEEFRKIVSTKKYTAATVATEKNASRNIYLSNHNKLLNMLEGCIGVKTGFTKKTGRCLVSAAERDGVELICVTLNASDDWNDHMGLLGSAFGEYKLKKVISKGQFIKTVPVTNGVGDVVGVVAADDVFVPAKDGERFDFETVYNIGDTIDAPVEENAYLGSMDIIYNGEKMASVGVVANGGVARTQEPKFFDKFKFIIGAAVLYFQK